MKKSVLLIMLCSLIHGVAFSQTNEEKTSPFQVSFFPPLSTNGSQAAKYTNGGSFNILAGISKNERSFVFGGLANIVMNDATGVQFAGLYNYIGNNGKGFTFAGLMNNVKNDHYGMLFAGLVNTSSRAYGEQFAGLANVACSDFDGLQFAGLFNQVSSLKGVQFAGLGNVAGEVKGFQFGGLFNVAKTVKGVQFASILNIAEENDYPIGFINIIKNGEKSIGVSYDDTGSSIISFRSGGRVLYGILGVGYNHRSDDEQYVVEGGFGAHINIVPKFRINTELKAQNMSSFSSTYIVKSGLSILPAFKLLPQLEIFAGPNINYMMTDNIKNENMFPGNNLWKKYGDDELQQCFIGYTAGIQFIF